MYQVRFYGEGGEGISRELKVMYHKLLKITIEVLLKLPKNPITDLVASRLLSYFKQGMIKTRYGYYIDFRVTNRLPTAIRKSTVTARREEEYINILTKLVEPGDYVIDGGAHEGYISLLMSGLVGNNGRVFSIEPNIENLAYFRRNVEINSADNISIIDKAIGDKISKATFHYDNDAGAWGSLIHLPNSKTKQEVIVDVDTLDNLFYKTGIANKIKLIKLDTEGNELNAFLGGEKLITECKPHIGFEVSLTVWSYHAISVEVMFDFLREKGYELFVVKNKKLYPYQWLYQRVMNMVAIHNSKISDLLNRNIFA